MNVIIRLKHSSNRDGSRIRIKGRLTDGLSSERLASRFSVLGSRPLGALLLASSPNQFAIMNMSFGSGYSRVSGASWNWPDIPLRPRYLCIPMGYWPFRPGCRCPKCHTVLRDRSRVGWCIMCGKFGCSSCCESVWWRRCRRNRFGRAIKPPDNWMCATWGLVLQGQLCALGWSARAIHVCDEVSCRQKFHIATSRMEEHGIDLQLSYYWA